MPGGVESLMLKVAEINDIEINDKDEIDELPEFDDEEDEIDNLPDVDDYVYVDRTDEIEKNNNLESDIPDNFPPNSKIKIDDKIYYTDDNSNVYRIDDKLLPNTEYDINGYHYKTDDMGRIISASGILKKKDHQDRLPIKDSMDTIGKGDQKDTDDRGHIIADRFNGSNGLENIVPMDSELNRHGDYGKLEDYLAEAVENGDNVEVEIEVVYEDNLNRPSEFRITVIINGEKEVYVYKNGGES